MTRERAAPHTGASRVAFMSEAPAISTQIAAWHASRYFRSGAETNDPVVCSFDATKVSCMNRLALVLVFALLACAKDEEPPRSRAEFCLQWAAAACSVEVVSVCQAEDVDACRVAQEGFCRDVVPDTFVDDHADECLEAVKDAYVDADLNGEELVIVRSLGEPCDRLARGTRDEGDSCTEDNDCNMAAGFDCAVKAGDATGSCELTEEVGPGQDCDEPQQVCSTGFYCNGENCVSGDDIGEACMHHEECGEEGFCGTTGECEERKAVNEACAEDAECEDGICYDFDGEQVCTDRIVLTRTEVLCEDLR